MLLLLLLHTPFGESGNKRKKIENLKYTHTQLNLREQKYTDQMIVSI